MLVEKQQRRHDNRIVVANALLHVEESTDNESDKNELVEGRFGNNESKKLSLRGINSLSMRKNGEKLS